MNRLKTGMIPKVLLSSAILRVFTAGVMVGVLIQSEAADKIELTIIEKDGKRRDYSELAIFILLTAGVFFRRRRSCRDTPCPWCGGADHLLLNSNVAQLEIRSRSLSDWEKSGIKMCAPALISRVRFSMFKPCLRISSLATPMAIP
jgi:hypothetical protein